MQGEKYLVLGKDKKMQSCRMQIISQGFECDFADNEIINKILPAYDNIILPLPTLANGCIAGTGIQLADFCKMTDNGQCVFCGNISPKVFNKAFSYYYDESFLIKNSRLTAQGTLRLVLENIDYDLYTSNAAVIGYGRCGKAICRSLRSAGANVTSFSRRSQTMAQAENDGMNVRHCNGIDELYKYDIIVNTVPENIIGESVLEHFSENNLYIETASKPYGFNIGQSDKYNFRYILAESLPGKFTPVSAGKNIADTVLNLAKEGEK